MYKRLSYDSLQRKLVSNMHAFLVNLLQKSSCHVSHSYVKSTAPLVTFVELQLKELALPVLVRKMHGFPLHAWEQISGPDTLVNDKFFRNFWTGKRCLVVYTYDTKALLNEQFETRIMNVSRLKCCKQTYREGKLNNLSQKATQILAQFVFISISKLKYISFDGCSFLAITWPSYITLFLQWHVALGFKTQYLIHELVSKQNKTVIVHTWGCKIPQEIVPDRNECLIVLTTNTDHWHEYLVEFERDHLRCVSNRKDSHQRKSLEVMIRRPTTQTLLDDTGQKDPSVR